jgi:hypothetical protein
MDPANVISDRFPNLIVHFGDSSSEYNQNETKPVNVFDKVIDPKDMVFAQQVHQDHIHLLQKEDMGAGITKKPIPATDAFICDISGIFPAIVTADCVPVLIYDFEKQVVAAVHSGRVGTMKAITQQTINMMQTHFGSSSYNLVILIGPAICAAHYPVDKNTFEKYVSATQSEQNFPFIDLKKTIHHQIRSTGVPAENILSSDICTYHDQQYFSYRRERTKSRQISLIGMLKK